MLLYLLCRFRKHHVRLFGADSNIKNMCFRCASLSKNISKKIFHKNNNSGNEISVEQSLVILVLEQGWTISFVICPNKKNSPATLYKQTTFQLHM